MNPVEVSRDTWTASRAHSAAVAQTWRRSPEQQLLAATFDSAAAASPSIARERALALLGDTGWAARLLAPLATALSEDLLFEPPLKVSRRRGRVGVVLFDAPPVRITASIASARAIAAHPPRSVILPGRVSITRYVRAGEARIRRWRVDGDERVQEIAPLDPADGAVVIHDGCSEGHVIADAGRDVVMLTAVLRGGTEPVTREFRLADGSLHRTAGTDDAASRTALLLTLLRLSERADAAPVFDAATRNPAPHARWSAMREWLALDVSAAVPRLREMVADGDADVGAVAHSTLALVERRMVACRA